MTDRRGAIDSSFAFPPSFLYLSTLLRDRSFLGIWGFPRYELVASYQDISGRLVDVDDHKMVILKIAHIPRLDFPLYPPLCPVIHAPPPVIDAFSGVFLLNSHSRRRDVLPWPGVLPFQLLRYRRRAFDCTLCGLSMISGPDATKFICVRRYRTFRRDFTHTHRHQNSRDNSLLVLRVPPGEISFSHCDFHAYAVISAFISA